MRRAQDSGAVRDDIAFNDPVYMITAISLAIGQEGGSTTRIGQLPGIFFDGVTTRASAWRLAATAPASEEGRL